MAYPTTTTTTSQTTTTCRWTDDDNDDGTGGDSALLLLLLAVRRVCDNLAFGWSFNTHTHTHESDKNSARSNLSFLCARFLKRYIKTWKAIYCIVFGACLIYLYRIVRAPRKKHPASTGRRISLRKNALFPLIAHL